MALGEVHRRSFLHHSVAALAGLSAASRLRAAAGSAGYGEPQPVKDETTGLELLKLPPGFRYISFGWTGTKLDDGFPTPGAHDGMAVVKSAKNRVTLIRNHEVSGTGKPIGDPAKSYDRRGRGGCTTLVFDTAQGKLLESRIAISGTARNCAGGPTPWGTWLTCEEIIATAEKGGFEQSHGWIFEVSEDGNQPAVPLTEMGWFNHEAVAVDPQTGIVYETEDKDPSGFYRYLPNTPGKLLEGGQLEMLKVSGQRDVRRGVQGDATEFECSWVKIETPDNVVVNGKVDDQAIFKQGQAQGGTSFARLEGCWEAESKIYFTATSGGKARLGQVWEYDPAQSKLRLVYESPGKKELDYPDNLTVSPRGGILLCEDGSPHQQRLVGLTMDGVLFPFAVNNVNLSKPVFGAKGNFTEQEWAGVTFSGDGQWMFANIQTPGITFAITGPWENGQL